jgi:FtsP/CotA-like multicopper oxidase with cupredoxin domain
VTSHEKEFIAALEADIQMWGSLAGYVERSDSEIDLFDGKKISAAIRWTIQRPGRASLYRVQECYTRGVRQRIVERRALILAPAMKVKELEAAGEYAMKASLAKGMPHGYEVGYQYFTIDGRMLGHGEPVRVKHGERVLFHVVNGSATEIRSLPSPGHVFRVLALDGNPVPAPAMVPVLWLGTAERISAIVEMNNPGVWIMGDLADDDRSHGMGIVVEYAGRSGKPSWAAPKPFHWDYLHFAKAGAAAPAADQTFEMLIAKDNAADGGFNRWTINGAAFPMIQGIVPASFHLKQGGRYRVRLRNASDDIHPVHLHRHSFELTRIAGVPTAGVLKDVVMLGGYQEIEFDFTADNPGLTLFHCLQQLHMDFGFMTLFDYV